ncbi:MAG: hypothetical protein EBQ61_01055 [Micrococcales bacterium]|nr:hypothetical protein [Micrococcales bacterium]
MLGRLQHFRGAYLLMISSALSFWVISFWWPLGDYLKALNSTKYADYKTYILVMVGVYLCFALINLIVAGLYATRISANLKLLLAVIPASILFLTPFILTIPISQRFPNQNYFAVFQALYRLFRFTKPTTFAAAIIISVVILALNFLAAVMVKRAGSVDKVPAKLRTRYLGYTAGVTFGLAIFMVLTLISSNMRNLDRQSCYDYRDLEVPVLDSELVSFFNDVTLYGQQAGTKDLSTAMQQFAAYSRQYDAALQSDVDSAVLTQYQQQVAISKQIITDICSEFGTD